MLFSLTFFFKVTVTRVTGFSLNKCLESQIFNGFGFEYAMIYGAVGVKVPQFFRFQHKRFFSLHKEIEFIVKWITATYVYYV